jgi:hypothetical protein
MNRLITLIISLFAWSLAFPANSRPSGNGNPKGIYEIKCGKVVMKVSADGGRIVSLSYGKNEFLTQSTEHENFGSTLWTSPQSDWGWPPYDVLDNREYQVNQVGDSLVMISQPDSVSGFQFEKRWHVLGKRGIRIEYLIRRISKNEKAVGPWEVTRVPCGGIVFFPYGAEGKVPESSLKLCQHQGGINWLYIDKKPVSENQKLFSSAKEGWLAYALDGFLFVKIFPDITPASYSPEQGEVEIYVNKNKVYTELENHGAYRMLEPGETLVYAETWLICPIPEKVKIAVGNQELVALVRKEIGIINEKLIK